MSETNAGVVFLSHFEDLQDVRESGKVRYPLSEILLLCLCGVLAGADGWVEIAEWGKAQLSYLRRFLPYAAGTPSHDTVGDLFKRLHAETFRDCFISWVDSFQVGLKKTVAIDGKTLRHSFDENQSAIHLVSAWASEQQLVLGQEKVDCKSNEITAIPKLLDLLELEGAIVTIDAMGCQKAIAEKIRDKKADYILALKENQPTLEKDVREFLGQQKTEGFKNSTAETCQNKEKGHGRIECRTAWITTDVDWLKERHPDWKDLSSIGMVRSQRTQKGKTTTDTRYFISSLKEQNAQLFAKAVREHWGVEKMHWIMDVVFDSDQSRIRKDQAPQNFATIQQMALNLLKRFKDKASLNIKRKKAGWDTQFLTQILQGN
jgi:predicted transposase YbfD/YdcC